MANSQNLKLEDFVLWRLNALVDIRHEDPILFRKQYDKLIEQPTILSKDQFKVILDLFEPFRDTIEKCLNNFNNNNSCAMDENSLFSLIVVPSTILLKVQQLICSNFGE